MKRIALILMMLFVYPSFGADIEPGDTATCDNDTLNSTNLPVNLRAEWTANTINLTWNAAFDGAESISPTTCQYGGGITLQTPPERPGYTFQGWKLKQCSLIDYWNETIATETIAYDFTHVRWKSVANATWGYTMREVFGTENSGDLNPGEWTLLFSNGELKGQALCSPTNGSYGKTGSPNETDGGQFCWCAATNFGDQCPVKSPSWVFLQHESNICANYCAYHCPAFVRSYTDLRSAIFGVTE